MFRSLHQIALISYGLLVPLLPSGSLFFAIAPIPNYIQHL